MRLRSCAICVGGLLSLRSFTRPVGHAKFILALLKVCPFASVRRADRATLTIRSPRESLLPDGCSPCVFDGERPLLPLALSYSLGAPLLHRLITPIGKDCTQVVAIGFSIRKHLELNRILIACRSPRSSHIDLMLGELQSTSTKVSFPKPNVFLISGATSNKIPCLQC